MGMVRFLLATGLTAAAAFAYATWAREQTEGQVTKMQLSSYNTPGTQAPIPPAVAATGMSLLSALWFIQRKLMRQSWSGAAASMIVGSAAGVGALLYLGPDNSA